VFRELRRNLDAVAAEVLCRYCEYAEPFTKPYKSGRIHRAGGDDDAG
jgi:hypothetical protein